MEKTIICFANSRKNNGSCIAGKEIDTKNWIRPVSERITREIQDCEQCYKKDCDLFCDGVEKPELLDIIRISFDKHLPNLHQIENYEISKNTKFEKIGKLDTKDVDKYLDTVVGGYRDWETK